MANNYSPIKYSDEEYASFAPYRKALTKLTTTQLGREWERVCNKFRKYSREEDKKW